MKCFRCGYCCTKLLAVVIDDPNGPFEEGNFRTIGTTGEPERCPHLCGPSPGKYWCSVHDKEWYPKSPCAQYQSHWGDRTCRVGEMLTSEKYLNNQN